MNRNAEPPGHLPGFDAVRAVAISLVIAAHTALELGWHFQVLWIPGDYGLVTFFVLSGFLITHLLLHEHGEFGAISVRHFYLRRALKILLLLYGYWLVAVLVLRATHQDVPWNYAWSTFFYYSDYFHAFAADRKTLFSHTWSLAVEEQFYLLWPLLLTALARRPERLIRALAGILVGLWVWRWVLTFGFPKSVVYRYFAFDTRADAIFVGCLAATLYREGKLGRFLQAIVARPLLPLATLALMSLVALPQLRFGYGWRDAVGHTLFPPLTAVLLLQLMQLGRSSWRWLEWPAIRYPGKLSYSLYLWQQLTIPLAVGLLPGSRRPAPGHCSVRADRHRERGGILRRREACPVAQATVRIPEGRTMSRCGDPDRRALSKGLALG